MTSRNYLGALALSFLGCSSHNTQGYSPSSGFVESPIATSQENEAMDYVLSSLEGRIEQNQINPFHGKRVSLLYSTMDGPISGKENYTGGRPVNSGLVDAVRSELRERKAYVFEEGVFRENYESRIAASRMPNMNPADFVVIADENPHLNSDFKNVYFVQKDGNKYRLVEANK